MRGDDANDPTTFLVSFDEAEARYLVSIFSPPHFFSQCTHFVLVTLDSYISFFMTQPLPTKINLSKRRAREGRSGDEIEHFSVPSRVTVRKRAVAATIEQRDFGVRTQNHPYEYSFLFCFGY